MIGKCSDRLTRRRLIQGLFGAGIAIGSSPRWVQAKRNRRSEPRRWALLVGVAKYAPRPGLSENPDDLHGPDNDIPAMRELLLGKYGFDPDHIRTLQNNVATRQAILDGWEWLRDNAVTDDQVFFYYSGHGTRVRRLPGDPTPGRYTSALCPHDARQSGVLPGYELGKRIDALATEDVIVVVDACSSGSATRSPFLRARYLEWESKEGFDDPFAGSQAGADAPNFVPSGDARKQRERYLGASRIGQPALDAVLLPKTYPNPKMGAMTYFLLQELRADTANRLTYAELQKRLHRHLLAAFHDDASEPQISGPNLTTEPLLALPQVPAAPSTAIVAEVLKVQGQTIALRAVAGAVLAPGSVLETRAPADTREWREVTDRAERAQIRLTTVSGAQATGTLLRGMVEAGQRVAELMHGTEVPAAADAAITVVPDTGDRVRVYRGATPLTTVAKADLPALLQRLAAIEPLVRLQNQLPGVTLTVTGGGQTAFAQRRIGEKLPYVITASQDGFLTIFALAADGKITGGSDIPVQANIPFTGLESTITPPAGLDITKIVYTRRPIAVPIPATGKAFEEQGGDAKRIVASIVQSLRGGINASSERGQDFAALAAGGAAAPAAIAVDGWATADFFLQILPAS